MYWTAHVTCAAQFNSLLHFITYVHFVAWASINSVHCSIAVLLYRSHRQFDNIEDILWVRFSELFQTHAANKHVYHGCYGTFTVVVNYAITQITHNNAPWQLQSNFGAVWADVMEGIREMCNSLVVFRVMCNSEVVITEAITWVREESRSLWSTCDFTVLPACDLSSSWNY